MKQAKILLFNFIFLPSLLLTSTLNTGDAYSKSSMTTSTDGEFVVIQNNDATAISNTGNKTGSESSGDSTAVSEINIENGDQVQGKLKVEANGEKKELKVDKPGSYKLEIDKEGNIVATSQSEMKEKPAIPSAAFYWRRFLNFIFSFFKQ